MSTRSRIGIKRNDGSIESIYCHWDGYPEKNGLILYNHYNNLKKINSLIELGDISSLRKNIIPKSDKHSFNEPESDTTIAYHRDRNEDLNILKSENQKEFEKSCCKSDQNYAYLYDNKKWYIARIPFENNTNELEFKDLKTVLKELNLEIQDKEYLI